MGRLCAEELPSKFVRVTSLEDLTEDAWYLIGAIDPTNNGFYLLKAEKLASSNKKLKGQKLDLNPLNKPYVEASDPKILWHFTISTTKETTLISIYDYIGNCIVAPKKDNTDLVLAEKNATQWKVAENTSSDTFQFQHSENGSKPRWLSLSIGTEYDYYGNFVDEVKDLYLFKSISDFTEASGTATWPMPETTYTLQGNRLIANEDLSPTDITPYELSDGTLAYSPHLALLQGENEAEGCFSLKNKDGNTLCYDMTWGDTPSTWTLTNGHITTTEMPVRYLTYFEGRFCVMTQEEVQQTGKAIPALLTPVGAPPTQAKENGRLTLGGSWNADALAALETEGITSIDATALCLPKAARAFDHEISGNVPIYVQESQQTYVPDSWNFVVLKSGADYTLMKATTLQDHSELDIPFPFEISTMASLTYCREAHTDGQWETLCLPFEAQVPEGFEAREFVSLKNETLNFRKVASLSAGVPVLLRYTKAAGGTKEIEFKAHAGRVSTKMQESAIFRGTFRPLIVASTSEDIYLLEKTGEAFILADEGSRLAPFRCYIHPEHAQSIRLRLNEETTGVVPQSLAPRDSAVYTLDGKRAGRLSPGTIYIQNHKKQIKPL